MTAGTIALTMQHDSDPGVIHLTALRLHPVKSCGAIEAAEARLVETGLEWDREWMVVDHHGEFVTQREHPRMALVQPALRHSDLVLRAPGMLALHLQLDAVESPCRVRVWDDEMPAWDMGTLAAQWFSDFLGVPGLRLVRSDPDHRRLSDRRWTGEVEAANAFSDGFPLLVASSASLAELNRRLAAAGRAPVAMARFRPNLVLDGLAAAHEEDFVDTLTIDAPEGPVVVKLVKPCARCSIPDVDPATAAQGHAVADALAAYRADARVDGGLTFGMNAIVLQGLGHTLHAGAAVRAVLAF